MRLHTPNTHPPRSFLLLGLKLTLNRGAIMHWARVKDYNLLSSYSSSSWPLQVSFACVAQPACFCCCRCCRVLSYQLTYFSLSHSVPVYKPPPAEDVEYSAWKIDGHSPATKEKKRKRKRRRNITNVGSLFVVIGPEFKWLSEAAKTGRLITTARY